VKRPLCRSSSFTHRVYDKINAGCQYNQNQEGHYCAKCIFHSYPFDKLFYYIIITPSNMKKILIILSVLSFGCAFPIQILSAETTPTPEPTLAPTQTPLSTAEPGTEANPLILALAPSPRPADSVISAG